ncbi:protoglobin domain-containing protein [Thermus igniterrae]|uniref:protoglobin domain-containing protein n=1 Tax=Thermus igniterrae TaxID=88189 RepID=UPI0003614712|nr:protoglobin domain-containing protein [Thermus igniterrae]
MKPVVVWEEALVLDLPPLPEEVFADLLAFGGLGEEARRAMRLDAERLLEGAAAFVARVYDHLSRHPGTARALGWEGRVPEEELYLRRAFFSAWLARTFGVDTSPEFAREVYRAGLWHGGLGPKAALIPPEYVGLAFAEVGRYVAERVGDVGPWLVYLAAQVEVMRKGFDAALALKEGRARVSFQALGLAYPALPKPVALQAGSVGEALGKVFAAHPALRDLALEALPAEEEVGLWLSPKTLYSLRPRWAVLRNGRDVRYLEGLATPLGEGDLLTLLPPGR